MKKTSRLSQLSAEEQRRTVNWEVRPAIKDDVAHMKP